MIRDDKLRHLFLGSALAAAIAVAVFCGFCLWGIVWNHGVPVDYGWQAQARGDRALVGYVEADGPARNKLLHGDEIVAINGSEHPRYFGQDPLLAGTHEPYSMLVRRHGALLPLTLTASRTPQFSFPLYFYLVLALLDLVLAAWIGLARPDDAAARVAFFVFLGMALTFAAEVLTKFRPPLAGTALAFAMLLVTHAWRPLEWCVAFDFALRFPEPIPQPRLLRRMRVLLYCAGVLLWLFAILPALAQALNLGPRSTLLPAWFPLERVDSWRPIMADALGAVALLAVPVIFARNYAKLTDPSARKRLRWAALSIVVATLPITVGITLRFLLAVSGHNAAADGVDNLLNTVGSFATVLAPIGITYAIVKHRVLGIRFVIRRSLQYLLARNVLRIVVYLPLIAIAADAVLHPKEPVQDLLLRKAWWFYLFLAATALVSLRYRYRLTSWVDTRFFRSAYEEEVILSELTESMQACETAEELAVRVLAQVERVFYPSALCVLLKSRSTGTFSVLHPNDSPLALYFHGVLTEPMRELLEADKAPRALGELKIPKNDSSQAFSENLRHTLVTPITSASGELLAVLLLGERKSEQPYSARDRKLLQSMATQIAIFLEILGLKDRVQEEGRVRIDVLGRLERDRIQLVLECSACGACYTGPATHCAADGVALSMSVPVERVVNGKYRLDRRIGAGGMATVYQAQDLMLDRKVAVKVMTGRLFGNIAALRRFEREARAVAKLQHPNIVAIYDFGSLRGDGAYLVMQLISGFSWRRRLSSAGAVSGEKAASWFDQLCDAVGYAHANGIVHRDLKPENVLVSEAAATLPKITVVDFGLAKLQARDNLLEALTTEGAVMGTYGYMSPEQRAGEHVDARTDVFSMGVMVAETLSGCRPPRFGASREWLATVLAQAHPSPVVNELSNLLERCLAESVDDRLSDVGELRRSLIPLLRECAVIPQAKAASAGSNAGTTLPLQQSALPTTRKP